MSKCIYCGENEAGEYGFCDAESCVAEANEPNDYMGDF